MSHDIMFVLKICNGECGKRPVYWIDGGLHAREWISPAAVSYWTEVCTVYSVPAMSRLA